MSNRSTRGFVSIQIQVGDKVDRAFPIPAPIEKARADRQQDCEDTTNNPSSDGLMIRCDGSYTDNIRLGYLFV